MNIVVDSPADYVLDDFDLDFDQYTLSPTSPPSDTGPRLSGPSTADDLFALSYSSDERPPGDMHDRCSFPTPVIDTGYANSSNMADDSRSWTRQPYVSYVPRLDTSSTYWDRFSGAQSADCFDDGFISPRALAQDPWNIPASKHEIFTDEKAFRDAEFSPPAKRSCRTRPDIKGPPSIHPGRTSSPNSKPKSSSKSPSSLASTASHRSDDQDIAAARVSMFKHKSSTPSTSPPPPPPFARPEQKSEEHKARKSHNLVEKHYRNRLNSQFERLLAALPADQQLRAASTSGEDRRVSKAEVLDMARRRIRALEEERGQLLTERESLYNNIGLVQKAVVWQAVGGR